MSNRPRQLGMTLIELIVAIVIIAVGLAGVLSVFQMTVKNSADPLIRKQMLAIAEEMMEEITLKTYPDQANAAPATACGRETFNDIGDYDDYESVGICDLDGVAIAGLGAYTVTVKVRPEADLSGVPARQITVTVANGAETLSLDSWRTGWAL